MIATALKEPAKLFDLALNLDRTARPESKPSALFWEGDRLKWIGVMNADCSAFKVLAPETHSSLRDHLILFAQSGKYSTLSFLSAVNALNYSLTQHSTSLFDLAWLMKAFTLPIFQAAKGKVESFFIYWHDRYPLAIASDALQLLTRPLAGKKTLAMFCPTTPKRVGSLT